jgi:hypothetical protein
VRRNNKEKHTMKKKGDTFCADTPELPDGAGPAKQKPEPIETVRVPFETVLKCKLTDAEALAYAREMADVHAAIAQLTADMKSLVTEYKGKIALKMARLETLSTYVSTGCEHRTVKCERSYDYESRLVTEVRLDGQEPYVLNQRGLTNDELQRQLDLVER